MERQPKISVIIPVYNAEKYLKECLDSVRKQSLEEIEIICVDDGSKDGSLTILKEYEKRDSRITILCQSNQGAGVARNLGLEHARGEYVHFLDADDYLAEGAYETMYTNAIHFDADLVKTKVHGVDARSKCPVENVWYDMIFVHKKYFNRVVTFSEIPEIIARNVAVVPWNGIYRRSFLKENGISFNSLVCVNDRSFYAHVILKAGGILLLPDYTVYHRINMDTSLVGRRCEHFPCHFESYHMIEELCRDVAPGQKAVLLSAELNDIFSWYELYKDNEVHGPEVIRQMKEFLSDLDMDFFQKNGARMPWKRKWTMLIGDHDPQSVTYKLAKVLAFVPEKGKMIFWCMQDAGIGSTLRRILKKIV